MVTNEEVVRAWKSGKKAEGKAMMTDGHNLWSYALIIGKTVGVEKVAINHTKSGGSFWSSTTSDHVGLAKRYANRTVKPPKR